MPIYKLFVEGVSILQRSPFESVRVLQQGIFKHILMKYFRQDSEIVSIDLHNNGIFPVIEFQVEVSCKMYFSDLGIN